ncbi:ankyrin repeat domain-containing protein [Flavobacterium sp. RHBU_3]|uniref:ankyrin repeat domain-containing protein n=1 Tax=Flavobacterium sp. RHBU_3 TaxID=3391184 RepID=UPI0039853BE6
MNVPEQKEKAIDLRFAIKKNLNDEAKSLIDLLGVDYYIERTGTALLVATLHNNTEIATYCIEKGADVNVTDPGKFTPLIYASIAGNTGLAKLLLEKDADIHHQNKFEKSAISKAVEDHPENLELIELLLKHGGDPFVEENYKRERRTTFTAYDYALKDIKNMDVVNLIDRYFKR